MQQKDCSNCVFSYIIWSDYVDLISLRIYLTSFTQSNAAL